MKRGLLGFKSDSTPDDNSDFIDLLVKYYQDNQPRYEEQARQLLKENILHVTCGEFLIRYWVDKKGAYFKFSDDSGVSFSNSLSFIPLAGSEEEKIQALRDQFAKSEARAKTGV